METNQQVHQPDGPPPGLPFNGAEGQRATHTLAAGPAVRMMKVDHQLETGGDLAPQPASPAETSGVSPEVFPQVASGRPTAKDCTTRQLFEIVIDVAHIFRSTARDVIAPHKDYILRLKNDVFKVRFGSAGKGVPVSYVDAHGVSVTKKMRWSDFCEKQFGVSADWISRICGDKAEGCRRKQAARPESEKPAYKHGYHAAKAELQPQLKAAAERQDALGKRIAEMEGENRRLRTIADEVQQQSQEGVDGATADLPPQLERLKEFALLATEAFRIINGKFGERLMGSPEGNRLVELAKKAAAIKWKVVLC